MSENKTLQQPEPAAESPADTGLTRKKQWFWGVVLAVVVIDQITKWWVRTTPELHREILIEGWLMFNLTSNPGMAMGISWAPTWVISLVAIAASAGIIWYTFSLLRAAPPGFMVAMGLIIGGAFGNIMDRLYMGYVEGYGGLLSGHVVDFIYFNYIWPEWVPWLGGSVAFPYIFNMADVAISVAVIVLIGGAKWLLPQEQLLQQKEQADFDAEAVARRQMQDEHPPSRSQATARHKPADETQVDEAVAIHMRQVQEHPEEGKENAAPGSAVSDSPQKPPARPTDSDLLHTQNMAANIVKQVQKATEETEALKRAARGEQSSPEEKPDNE